MRRRKATLTDQERPHLFDVQAGPVPQPHDGQDVFKEHVVRDAEDANGRGPVGEPAAQGVRRLKADDEEDGPGIADVVVQMVQDPAGFTHPGRGDDEERVWDGALKTRRARFARVCLNHTY